VHIFPVSRRSGENHRCGPNFQGKALPEHRKPRGVRPTFGRFAPHGFRAWQNIDFTIRDFRVSGFLRGHLFDKNSDLRI
jgi:hypothetical protein